MTSEPTQPANEDEFEAAYDGMLARVAELESNLAEANVDATQPPGEEFTTSDVGYPTASDIALVARATGGGIRSAELLPEYEDEADEDVHRAAAEAWLAVDPDGPTVRVLAGMRTLMAAVDRAVELTEQRVRAEMAATCSCYDGNPANYEGPHADCPVHGAIRAFNEASRDIQRLHADLAAMTARAESAEARIRRWGGKAPLSAPSAPVSAPEPSTVVREGSEGLRGSEDASGGAA